jgi:hypothetical protein
MITIQEDVSRGLWVADWQQLTGPRPAGEGTNPRAALGDLFHKLLAQQSVTNYLSLNLANITSPADLSVVVLRRGKWRRLE